MKNKFEYMIEQAIEEKSKRDKVNEVYSKLVVMGAQFFQRTGSNLVFEHSGKTYIFATLKDNATTPFVADYHGIDHNYSGTQVLVDNTAYYVDPESNRFSREIKYDIDSAIYVVSDIRVPFAISYNMCETYIRHISEDECIALYNYLTMPAGPTVRYTISDTKESV